MRGAIRVLLLGILALFLCESHVACAWDGLYGLYDDTETGEAEWEVPEDLRQLDPETAATVETHGEEGVGSMLWGIVTSAMGEARDFLLSGVRAVGRLMAGVVLLGAVENLAPMEREKLSRCVAAAGALWVTAASADDLESLIGLGRETVEKIDLLGKGLLPVLAAAGAASGGAAAAAARQTATVLFSNVLLTAMDRLLLPMVYLYISTATAGAVLEGELMDRLGELLKKGICWALGILVTAFTVYLSVTGAVAGAADARAVKLAKAAVAGAVPVVGGILADAAESVLAGAGILRSVAGTFGVVALLGMFLLPFLHLGIQYLLYQGAALVSAAAGPARLTRLLVRLGDAFALVLAMTATAAVLLLIAVIASLSVTLP